MLLHPRGPTPIKVAYEIPNPMGFLQGFQIPNNYLHVVSGLARCFSISDYMHHTTRAFILITHCKKFWPREVCEDAQKFQQFPIFDIQLLCFKFQIPFGIPSELYEIPVGVGPFD